MAEALSLQCGEVISWTADGTYTKGDVIQVPDGRAGVVLEDCTVDQVVGVDVTYGAIYEVPKTTSMIMLIGSRLFWDHSANKAHLLHGADRDFYLGCAQTEDLVGTGTTIMIALNVEPVYTVALEHGFETKPVSTAGFPHALGNGRGVNLILDATNEAQKMDAMTARKVSVTALAQSIFDCLLDGVANGNNGVLDVNIGLANATHATDADSITEHMFIHLDGNDLNINLQSKDGTTTVAAVDTTIDYVLGTPILIQFDLRSLADIQVYINGVNVLPNSTFRLDNATGPIRVLAHAEKSANATPGNYSIMLAGLRTAQDI